jgi:hypothetical protein
MIPTWLFAIAAVLGDPRTCAADYEPTSSYEVESIEGWTVYVSRRLVVDQADVGRKVLELVRVKLYDIARQVPEPALGKLRRVPFWLELADKDVKCACYHPSRDWLAEHGFNPEKARAVEIGNADKFLKWTGHQPSMVLHELAHAYHDRFLGGYGNAEIAAAHRRAVQSKRYESVLYCDGKKKAAYAAKNPMEYFAELSEAWFGVNDFYPFVRAEVLQFDPEMAALLAKLWGR